MQFIILHGAFGQKNSNWFPWLQKELIKLNQKVFLEQFPIDDFDTITKLGKNNNITNQNLKSWLQTFEKNILSKINKEEKIIFIGHSLAPVFILHLIGKYNLQARAAFFVAPFLTSLNNKEIWQYDVVNNTFYSNTFNWNKIQKLIDNRFVLYGDNDPYVPVKYSLEFAKKTKSQITLIQNGFHLGSNLSEFPQLLLLIKRII